MRDKSGTSVRAPVIESEAPSDGERAPDREVPCDERLFFESFYRSSVRGEVRDRVTMGSISDPEARFHYNATENSIIRSLLRREPPPEGPMVETWRFMEQRRQRRLLDIGSGTGHWIDFFREAFLVAEAVGVEITAHMSAYLKDKYLDDPAVTILEADVADAAFSVDAIGGPVDLVSAIGVLFHIVDDGRWESAVRNLAGVLKPDGLLLVGGDFGAESANVQFNKIDEFSTWAEHDGAPDGPEIRVNKRLRSLGQWHHVAAGCGLEIVDLVRTDSEQFITTPENDLLVLARNA